MRDPPLLDPERVTPKPTPKSVLLIRPSSRTSSRVRREATGSHLLDRRSPERMLDHGGSYFVKPDGSVFRRNQIFAKGPAGEVIVLGGDRDDPCSDLTVRHRPSWTARSRPS